MNITKNIYILWFQGFDNAPDVVKQCVNSWKYHNPDWNVILLDDTNLNTYVETYISNNFSKNKYKTALSDVVRIVLLKLYGGLWVDSTTFCNKPLNDWLPNYINEGFFAFDKPGADRLLSSWFIYADKDNYILDKWFHSAINYYNKYNKFNDAPHTYFWFHYLFGDLYSSDITFKEMWDKVPKLSANRMGPHYLQENGLFKNITTKTKTEIDAKITPLYKLSHKFQFPKYDEKLNIYYLYSTITNI
jgi:hypothetical protein